MRVFSPEETRRSRYQLLVLMLIPVLVVLAATFVFYTRIGLPKDTRNKGVLITPPVQINDLQLVDMQGKPVVVNGVKDDVWAFVIARSADCNAECRQRFWVNRQTRIALGKYQNHIRRIWLLTDGEMSADTAQWLAKEQPDIAVVRAHTSSWQALLGASNYQADINALTDFYLVDTRGFVMMYYTEKNTYKDVITDMKFLLKGVE